MYAYEPDSHVPVAMYDQQLGLHHIDTDHAGTPQAMYHHETGEEVWSAEHEVYGKIRADWVKDIHPVTGQPFEPGLRQPGQYEDIETGLYQNLHRYYDPNVGRYITADPIGLQGGLNAYQYCPNPVGYIDPLGLKCEKERANAYSVAFETTIPKEGVGTRASHFKESNIALSNAMESDAEFAKMMESLGVEIPKRLGKSPANWTWHHMPDQPGVMQLVPREQHQGSPWQWILHPGRIGGFKIWGSEY